MSMSRRSFIRRVALTVGSATMYFWIESEPGWAQGGAECTLPPHHNATRLIPHEPHVRTRFSATEMADPSKATALAKFRDAICKLKALPATDVIGWDKQIAQHCLSCAPSNPTNIHFSAYFLPWHRAYLYALERILRKLSGDDDLRLIYWKWEDDLTVPQIYSDPNQCLFYQNRDFQGLSASDVDVQPLLAIPTYLHFGGGAPNHTGAAFGGPHANVHDAFNGDMADLQYSPRDPIFYAHHGNIDRLFSSWLKIPGHAKPVFKPTDKVYFYDENRKLRFLLLSDLNDETKLGYKYSSYMTPRVKHPLMRTAIPLLHGNVVHPTDAQRVEMIKPHESRFLVVQNMSNLDQLPAEATIFGIFADEEPPVGTLSSSDPHFLGKVATVRSGGTNHKGPLTAAMEVSEKFTGMMSADKKEFKLSVAPLDRSGKTTAPAIPLAAEGVSVVE